MLLLLLLLGRGLAQISPAELCEYYNYDCPPSPPRAPPGSPLPPMTPGGSLRVQSSSQLEGALRDVSVSHILMAEFGAPYQLTGTICVASGQNCQQILGQQAGNHIVVPPRELTLQAEGDGAIVLDGQDQYGLLFVSSAEARLSLVGLTFKNGHPGSCTGCSAGSAARVYLGGHLNITRCDFTDNTADVRHWPASATSFLIVPAH